MAQRPATALNPAKLDLLRKALMVAPMTLDLTGLSMFPAIRAGDRCRVAAVDMDTVRVGDILLATRESRLFAHRVVEIRSGPPRTWIIKGDTLMWADPPVRAEDVLGQIIGLERRGRLIDLRSPARRRVGALAARFSGPYSRSFARATMLRRRALAKLAALPMWRARRRAAARDAVVRPATIEDVPGLAVLFGEQQALHSPMGAIDMDAAHEQARQMLQGAERSGATVWLAELDHFVAGHAVVGLLGPEGPPVPGWWVMSVYIKMTARGCGLAERMVRAGLDQARQCGEPCLRYAAFESNRASLALAEKLGFVTEESEIADRFSTFYESPDPRGPRLVVTKKSL
jgi:L-amino acid N-acyltransferase YncA